jgi:hypothetical protein
MEKYKIIERAGFIPCTGQKTMYDCWMTSPRMTKPNRPTFSIPLTNQ